MEKNSQITDCFENQTVFLTGGTGFLGKVLIEKLLRVCKDLKKIYILARPKKGKSVEERYNDFFELPVSVCVFFSIICVREFFFTVFRAAEEAER